MQNITQIQIKIKERKTETGFCPFCNDKNPKFISEELVENGDKYAKYGILVGIHLFPFLCLKNSANILKFDDDSPTQKINDEENGIFGKHELLVESENHDEVMGDMDEKHIKRIIDAYAWRYEKLLKLKDVNYVLIYKNHGKTSGASQKHPHSQIAGLNIVPKKIIARESQSYYDDGKKCKYCKMVKIESSSNRNIFVDENVVAFCSFAPKTSYEVRILPKRHVTNLCELNSDERLSIAKAMKKVTLKLKELKVDYNFFIHSGISKMHLNITFRTRGLMPWGSIEWGGLELSSDIHVVSVSPEDAAKFYNDKVEL